MTNTYPKNTTLEGELRKAFRNCGYGNINVEIKRFKVSAGYQIDTTAEFWIEIKKVKLTRKDVSRATRKIYKIVRRTRQK